MAFSIYNTILIVDDDPDDAEMLQDAIHEVDVKVNCIYRKNGLEAFNFLKSINSDQFPELIIMDMNMPLLNGRDCLKKIKSDPTLSNIPVIMYTTSRPTEFAEEMHKAGAANFITKPEKVSELRIIVKEILRGNLMHS